MSESSQKSQYYKQYIFSTLQSVFSNHCGFELVFEENKAFVENKHFYIQYIFDEEKGSGWSLGCKLNNIRTPKEFFPLKHQYINHEEMALRQAVKELVIYITRHKFHEHIKSVICQTYLEASETSP